MTKFKVHDQVENERVCNIEIEEGPYTGLVFRIDEVKIPEPQEADKMLKETGKISAGVVFTVVKVPESMNKSPDDVEKEEALHPIISGITQVIVDDWAASLKMAEKK